MSAVRVHPEQVTGTAFVRCRTDGTRDVVFNVAHSACGHTAVEAAGEALLAGCGHLHVVGSPLFSPSIAAAAETTAPAVKARGGTVSLGPNARGEMLRAPEMRRALGAMPGYADVFLPSGPELFPFSDVPDENMAVAELLGYGVGCVVVKRGGEGATFNAVTSRGGSRPEPACPQKSRSGAMCQLTVDAFLAIGYGRRTEGEIISGCDHDHSAVP